MQEILKKLKEEHHSLPRWEDLPEIDLYMDQVISLMEKYLSDLSYQDTKLITPSMINNYVKLKLMPAPIKKKYSREHLAYLIIICSLKQVIPISNIKNIIDRKLETTSLADTLNFYSNLYDNSFHELLENCSKYISTDDKTIEDLSLLTAITATNCRSLSEKLFFLNLPKKIKIKNKKEN